MSNLTKLTQQANDRPESRWVSVSQNPHQVLTIKILTSAHGEKPALISPALLERILSYCSGQDGSVPGEAATCSHYITFLLDRLQNVIIITSNRLKLQFMAIQHNFTLCSFTVIELPIRNYP